MKESKSRVGWLPWFKNIKDSYLWKRKPYERMQAYLDIEEEMRYKDKIVEILFKGKKHKIGRNQLITSIPVLMKKWNWTEIKVKRLLEAMKEEKRWTSTKLPGIGIIITSLELQRFDEERKKSKEEKII